MFSSTLHKTATLDAELLKRAELLKEGRLFMNGSDSLYEKQLIFYVLAGVKPASEVGSSHAVWITPSYAEHHPDDQAEVGAFLKSLGLCYAFKPSYDGSVTVALSEEVIQQAYRAIDTFTDEASIYEADGRLFGYPETAIAACVANWVHGEPTLISIEEQEQIEREAGLPRATIMFRLSKEHWQAELAVVKSWYAVLVQYGMDQ